MAFTVEDGTGVVGANSYGTIDGADAYFEDRGVTTWTGTDTQKESYLIRATDYIETRFASRFKGEKEFPDTPQGLSFPRINIDDSGDYVGVPECLKRATYEYALRAIAGALAPDPVFEANGRLLVGKRTKVGPIETDLKYAESGAGSTPAAFRPYPAADALLRPLLYSTRGVYR
jgi:hypothetical protein